MQEEAFLRAIQQEGDIEKATLMREVYKNIYEALANVALHSLPVGEIVLVVSAGGQGRAPISILSLRDTFHCAHWRVHSPATNNTMSIPQEHNNSITNRDNFLHNDFMEAWFNFNFLLVPWCYCPLMTKACQLTTSTSLERGERSPSQFKGDMCRPRWSRGNVLASRCKVRGFKCG